MKKKKKVCLKFKNKYEEKNKIFSKNLMKKKCYKMQ